MENRLEGHRWEAGLPVRKLLRCSRGENEAILFSSDRGTFHKTNKVPFFKKIFLGFLLILDIESISPAESWGL